MVISQNGSFAWVESPIFTSLKNKEMVFANIITLSGKIGRSIIYVENILLWEK